MMIAAQHIGKCCSKELGMAPRIEGRGGNWGGEWGRVGEEGGGGRRGGGTRGEGEGGEGALHVEAREVVWRGRVLVSDRPNPCRRHACSRSAYASSAAELVSPWCAFSSTRFRVHATLR